MDINRTENSNEALDERIEQELDTAPAEEQKNTAEKPGKTEEIIKKDESSGYDKRLKTLSVGEWMLVIFAMLLPLINIIFMALWAFTSEGNIHRRNFARAAMLWLIIILIACVVAMAIAGLADINLLRGMIKGQAG